MKLPALIVKLPFRVVKATPLIVKLPFRAMIRWHPAGLRQIRWHPGATEADEMAPGGTETDAMGRLGNFVNFAAVSIKEIYYEDSFCNR